MNLDEHLDLVICQYDQPSIEVRLGDGQGGFGTPVITPAPASKAVDLAVTELNGDDYPDLVLVYELVGVSVFLGEDSGELTALPLMGLGQTSSRIGIGHLDGDQISDLLVTGDRGVWCFKGVGGGQFDAPFDLGESWSTGVAITDVTGDLIHDIIVANRYRHGVSVKAGNGSGGFGMENHYGGGRHPKDVVAADLDRNGHLDLITADFEGNTVHVLLSELPQTSAVDVELPMSQPIAALGLASPNPAPRGGLIRISMVDLQSNAMRIYDVEGRLVARLSRTPGSERFTWTGRDLSGRFVSAGQYFAKLDERDDTPTIKISILP
jgi:hypothetical protein